MRRKPVRIKKDNTFDAAKIVKGCSVESVSAVTLVIRSRQDRMTKKTYKVMIVAGETSGDLHAAKLVNAMRDAEPNAIFNFFGGAGDKMREAGVDSVVDSNGLSIVGLLEIARAFPTFLRVFNSLKKAAIDRRPDLAILVDFPDFNLKLAKSLSKRGFKIVYYISPQLWAWRRYRIRTISKYVDLVISILPFEKPWYSKHDVHHVEYVGSPLAREVHPTVDKVDFCRSYNLDRDAPIISLLPGSRHKEIARILPVMLEAAAVMSDSNPEIQFLIPVANENSVTDVDAVLAKARSNGLRLPGKLMTVRNETFDALNASDAAGVASGTATLETGIIGTPMCIVYKTSALNYGLLRPLIDVEHFGLVNLIAEERVAVELIQNEFTAQSLANELFRLLESNENRRVRERLKIATDKLGHGGASKRAAEAILKLIDKK